MEHLFTDPTESGDGSYGLLGTTSADGIFATYCVGAGECLNLDMIILFSTSGILPTNQDVICGFTQAQDENFSYWKECPEGDNTHKMTY